MQTERAMSVYETEPIWRLPQNWPLMFGANWRAWHRRRKTSLVDSRVLRRRARALNARLTACLPPQPAGSRHYLTWSWLSGLRRDTLWAGKYLVAWVQGYTEEIGEGPRLNNLIEAATEAKYAEGFASGFGWSPQGKPRPAPEPEDPRKSRRQASLRAVLDPELLDEFEQLAGHIYLAFDSDGRADPRRAAWRSIDQD